MSAQSVDPNEDNQCISYDKKSFSHRICDDLSEVILQWLPIEDKIRFTEVSKQFNTSLKNVCKRQRLLEVDYNPDRDCSEADNEFNNLVKYRRNGCDFDVKRMDRLLKTFKNINEIDFNDCQKLDQTMRHKVLDTITKNCSQLKTFCARYVISVPNKTQLIESFGHKFGPQLKSLNVCTDNDLSVKKVLKMCPNLESINHKFGTGIHINSLFQNNELLVKCLRKLNITYHFNPFADTFGDFTKKFELLVRNCPKLSHLCLSLVLVTSECLSQLMAQLSDLKELKILAIHVLNCDSDDYNLTESIESIAKNCKQLKGFEFYVTKREINSILNHILMAFKHFSSLKRLTFDSKSVSVTEISSEKADINCLQNCKQLTHLELNSYQIDDNFFANIDSVVPHLKCLNVNIQSITDQTLHSLAKLKNLESISMSIQMNSKLNSLTESSFVSLINCCKRLHTIRVCNETNITESTIDAIIQKSVENPGIYYKYYFKGIEKKFDLKAILESSANQLNNISINGFK